MIRTAVLALAAAFALSSAAWAAPQDRYAANGAVKIHYVVEGEGPLVVLLHGFPDYWATWKPLMAELNRAGWRTAALDLRGYNLSDKPDGVAAYAMPNLIGDVAAVIAAEGAKDAVVIGHDWGAAIAWQVAMNRPDLVNRLVILSVPHPAGFAREMATNAEQQKNSQYARNFQQPGFEKTLTAEGLAGWVKDAAEKPGYVEAFKRSDFAAMLNYYRANYPSGTGAATAAPPSMATAARIKAPTLVIHGMKDTALNAAGHAGTWDHVDADTTIVMFPQAAHFVQHDAKDQVNRTVKGWLAARR
ncbi:hydrolase, alpha/beta fold family [Phenylobacterium zucineum HLK1]|uniref:Hydrolase, alpha/beta fold family n=1 Tax=Phenylobacterium zucineum (strain HLK1) TaxID=450851 RepID=B4RH78_PHEZH|nr:alpha/beta hydrolase [Phenylobacterium zucineum]ACG79026.1 hydrolase, alpha/beta fold family [Phenylobacterium zucineum HLK1]